MRALRRGGVAASPAATVVALDALALAVRLAVLAVATVAAPSDSVGDVSYHTELVGDPLGALLDAPHAVAQYPRYLGMLEWLTAKPWLVLGCSYVSALRLGSITWDLIGMTLLLLAVQRRYPGQLVFVGLVWALSPLFWPASSFSAQDELIAAAVVAGAVLLCLEDRRPAAVVLGTVAMFAVKVLVAPVVLALVLTAPKTARPRLVAIAAVTGVVSMAVTWALSGTDGLTSQLGYRVDIIGFSTSVWSTLYLHHGLSARSAISMSVVVVLVGVLATLAVWWRRQDLDDLAFSRLAAALLFVIFALLAVSNPEYLCIAAPVGIIGAIGPRRIVTTVNLLAVGGLAWAINAVYYLLRRAATSQGYNLVTQGFTGEATPRMRLLDVTHEVFLGLYLCLSLTLAWLYLTGADRHPDARVSRPAVTGGSS